MSKCLAISLVLNGLLAGLIVGAAAAAFQSHCKCESCSHMEHSQ